MSFTNWKQGLKVSGLFFWLIKCCKTGKLSFGCDMINHSDCKQNTQLSLSPHGRRTGTVRNVNKKGFQLKANRPLAKRYVVCVHLYGRSEIPSELV